MLDSLESQSLRNQIYRLQETIKDQQAIIEALVYRWRNRGWIDHPRQLKEEQPDAET